MKPLIRKSYVNKFYLQIKGIGRDPKVTLKLANINLQKARECDRQYYLMWQPFARLARRLLFCERHLKKKKESIQAAGLVRGRRSANRLPQVRRTSFKSTSMAVDKSELTRCVLSVFYLNRSCQVQCQCK